MLALEPDEIHLWCTFFSDLQNDQALLDRYRELLNPAERQQHLRFYFAKDRCRYVVTRALVRTMLSRYVPEVRPENWTFRNNEYGRPEPANAEAAHDGLTFNLSHTDHLILLAVARNRVLGVDTENFGVREAAVEVADRYFSAQETATLRSLPEDHHQRRFFEYWTLKESYIKARGMGLSIPLDKFGFSFPGDRHIELTVHPELGDDAGRWYFWQFLPAPGYLAALCAERRGLEALTIVMRQIVPGGAEQPLEFVPFRTCE
jgi:4'-phosphopantetheinyl transferase